MYQRAWKVAERAKMASRQAEVMALELWRCVELSKIAETAWPRHYSGPSSTSFQAVFDQYLQRACGIFILQASLKDLLAALKGSAESGAVGPAVCSPVEPGAAESPCQIIEVCWRSRRWRPTSPLFEAILADVLQACEAMEQANATAAGQVGALYGMVVVPPQGACGASGPRDP